MEEELQKLEEFLSFRVEKWWKKQTNDEKDDEKMGEFGVVRANVGFNQKQERLLYQM